MQTLQSYIKLVSSYLTRYWPSTLFLGFLVISTLLRAFTEINVTIPCLIRLVTGHQCLGCGLTTATIHLLKGDVQAAARANGLVFVILPVLLVFFRKHWLHFVHDQKLHGSCDSPEQVAEAHNKHLNL